MDMDGHGEELDKQGRRERERTTGGDRGRSAIHIWGVGEAERKVKVAAMEEMLCAWLPRPEQVSLIEAFRRARGG